MYEEDDDAMLEITKGTNTEGLLPQQAHALDAQIMATVALANKLWLTWDQFADLCEAAWDCYPDEEAAA